MTQDIILFDRSTSEARNITQGQFDAINDFCISVKGDIVFSNTYSDPESQGLYFISSDEIQKAKQRIIQLDQRKCF